MKAARTQQPAVLLANAQSAPQSAPPTGGRARLCTGPAVWSPAHIGRAATLALHDELALAPKPGLVSFADSGSHNDMDAHTFMRSLFALRRYFVRIAELGAAGAPFAKLQSCGLQAEARMLAATGGVNTHRGAIFMLGLLCAAAGAAAGAVAGAVAGAAARGGPAATAGIVQGALLQHWGPALLARCTRTPTLPGGLAAQKLGLRSASQEAALGFPIVFQVAVPAWQRGALAGLGGAALRLQVFFEVMAVLDDANLAHRGGRAGLQHARQQARHFLAQGGFAQPQAASRAWAIHADFVARRLSPGGCADTLSAACFLHRLGATG